jgi:hypothetical protein
MGKKSQDDPGMRNGSKPFKAKPEEFDRFEDRARKLAQVPRAEVDAKPKVAKT